MKIDEDMVLTKTQKDPGETSSVPATIIFLNDKKEREIISMVSYDTIFVRQQ